MGLIGALIFTILIPCAQAQPRNISLQVPEPTARDNRLPIIRGETLLIEGRIDSHIYDYLATREAELKAVKIISLNSFGGSNVWGLLIATKIKNLNKRTRIEAGSFCASACTYIFAAGVEREAAPDARLGIHGARLGAGYAVAFNNACGDEGNPYTCRIFLTDWYQKAMTATLAFFELMESNGVSRDLRLTYLSIPDDPNWIDELNVIRKPDWPLSAKEALRYNLVTKIL